MSFNRKRRLKNSNPFTAEHGAGTVVTVLTGRTRGKRLVVTGMYTDKYGKSMAFCADGVKYTVENPKKKAASHLEFVSKTDAGTDNEIKLLLNH